MEQIIVTRKDNTTWPLVSKANVSVITRGEQRQTLSGEDIVTMNVESAVKLDFGIRDFITIFGKKYFLNNPPEHKKSGSRKHLYSVTWESRQYDLIKPLYLDEDIDGVSISPDFPLTGNLEFFMEVLINNACRVFGAGSWVLGDCPETDIRTFTFNNEKCLAALQRLCKLENFNKEFEITESAGVCTLNIKDLIGTTHEEIYEYGRGGGLWDIIRKPVNDGDAITRLYVFGSNKNLKSDYRGFAQRLKLPDNDMSYIEDSDAIAAYGLNEGVKIFENIFPHRTGSITSLGITIFEFIDSSMDFDLNAVDAFGNTLYLLPGTPPKIHFNTGKLAGYQFQITAYDHATKKFKVQQFADERGQVFPDPNSSAFQFSVNDEYVILDIMQPQTYVDAAESELLAAGQSLHGIVKHPPVQYSQTFEQIYFERKYAGQTIQNVFGIGDSVHIKDTDLGVDKSIRLKSFKRNILRHYEYNLDLYDYKQESLVNKLVSASYETSKVITSTKLNDISEAFDRALIKSLLNCLVVMNANTENQYLRCKLPLGCDYEIQTFTDSGQFPAQLWDSLRYASNLVVGGIKIGAGLAIDVNGVATVVPVFSGSMTVGDKETAQAGGGSGEGIILALGNEAFLGFGDRTLNAGDDDERWGWYATNGTAYLFSRKVNTNRLIVYNTGNVYIPANCSAESFTDRTPFYNGDALTEIMKISGKDGQIDHSTLPEFARVTMKRDVMEPRTSTTKGEKATEMIKVGEIEEPERDIGAMISILTKAVQQLIGEKNTMKDEIELLRKEIEKLKVR